MKTYLELKKIAGLEESATNLRDRLLVRLLFRIGCRVSEALGLTVDDIDFTQATITIKHLKSRLKLCCPGCGTRLRRKHVFCPGCGARLDNVLKQELEHRRVRTLPLDPDLLNMLQDYIQRGGPLEKDGKTLIFGINRHRAWQIVKDCADKVGLPKLINPETGRVHNVSPHKLRDAFAVYAVKLDDSGDELRLLQEHLGHQSFNTTAKYRKVSGAELRQWYGRLWNENKLKGDKA